MGFDALPVHEMRLLNDPDNAPSQRVAEGRGFRLMREHDGRLLFVSNATVRLDLSPDKERIDSPPS